VGVYLVFASLIVPALAAGSLWRAYALGASGYVLGLLASGVFDLPAGATIVLTLVLMGVMTAKGTVAKRQADASGRSKPGSSRP
jgi:zinc/manganese transport system permease protein